jgi:hypothetical protein
MSYYNVIAKYYSVEELSALLLTSSSADAYVGVCRIEDRESRAQMIGLTFSLRAVVVCDRQRQTFHKTTHPRAQPALVPKLASSALSVNFLHSFEPSLRPPPPTLP